MKNNNQLYNFKSIHDKKDWDSGKAPLELQTIVNIIAYKLFTVFGYKLTITSFIRKGSKNHGNGNSIDIRIKDMNSYILGYILSELITFVDFKVLFHKGTAYHIHLQYIK